MGVPYAEVIGDPIAHSKSPAIHKFWLEKLGREDDYRATRVSAPELPTYFASRRADRDWRGCNLTMPLKTLAAGLVDRITPAADQAGAVNCVTVAGAGLVGTNTDMAGIAAALPPPLSGRRACIVGAGGAAMAAVAALWQVSLRDIRVVARSRDRAAAAFALASVAPKFYSIAEAEQAMDGAEIVINASPLGMAGQPPMPADLLKAMNRAHPDAFVLDMVYAPVETPFLSRAKKLGFGWSDGLDTLVGQAREAFRLFYGTSPGRKFDAELRGVLVR
jgi:shikimate dehydrogenase